MQFLSDEWIEAMNAAGTSSGATGDPTIVIEQTVKGGPDGPHRFHVSIGDGSVRFVGGPAPDATVTFTQSYDTAGAIARGEQSAQAAFMTGDLKIAGAVRVLLDHQDLLEDTDDVFAGVRADTEY